MTALYKFMLMQGCFDMWRLGSASHPAVWRIRASELLDEHIAWDTRDLSNENRRINLPTVTVRKIQRAKEAGYRPCLFLDEIEKITTKEYKVDKLCEIINAVYDAEGQVVATSNKSVEKIAEKWGDDEAITVIRRIGAGRDAHSVLFG
jgi:hypothetical protein